MKGPKTEIKDIETMREAVAYKQGITNIEPGPLWDFFYDALILYYDAKAKRPETDEKIQERNNLYEGKDTIETDKDGNQVASKCHRNMCFELIESQINNGLPMPKITPPRPGKTELAHNLEKYLRAEMDRLQSELINDRVERGVLKQGTHYYLVGWDDTIRIGNRQGGIYIRDKAIQDVWPQPGIAKFEDADYVFVRDTVSLRKLRAMTGFNDIPQDPNFRGMVTTITYWYYNDEGYVCRLVWVENTAYILFNDNDYESRRIRVCKNCGEITDAAVCPVCGSVDFGYKSVHEETVQEDIVKYVPKSIQQEKNQPLVIAAKGTNIPFYAMRRIPIVCRVNISRDDSMFGMSDIDILKNNQITSNNITTKIEQNILKGGSVVTIPAKANFKLNNETLKVCRISDPRMADAIKVQNLQASIQQDDILADRVYQFARASLGITDSYQGKRDPTAESGKAKEIAAAQSAGRLESKRRMKDSAYADLYYMMFQTFLAYDDTQEEVSYENTDGEVVSATISRYNFLDGEPGKVFYDDSFLFSVDTASVLYTSRESLWQETLNNFQMGTMGPVNDPSTLLLFWSVMNELDYPLAQKCLNHISEQLGIQAEALQAAQTQARQMAQNMQTQPVQQAQAQRQPVQSEQTAQTETAEGTDNQNVVKNILSKVNSIMQQ